MTARLIALLALLSAFLPLVTDGFLAAIRPMMEELGIGVRSAQLSISLALAGFAAAQLFAGALADRIGRRPVLIGAIVLLMLASAGVGVAQGYAALLTFRFLQGVAAAAGPVLARAIVRDVCDRVEGARVLSLLGTGLAVVPLAVPILNGLVAQRFGWRATMITYIVFLMLPLGLTLRSYRETLARRDPHALAPTEILAAAGALLRNRVALAYLAACILGYAGLLTWVSASPHLLLGYFHVPVGQFGYYFAMPIVAYALGGLAGARALRALASTRVLTCGAASMFAGAAVLVVVQQLGVPGVMPFLSGICTYNFGWAILQPQAQAGILAGHPERAGRVSAILGFVQMLGGAGVGMAFAWLHDGTLGAAVGFIGTAALGVGIVSWYLNRLPGREHPA